MSRPHGLKGGPIQQRAERYADYFGLDEEMFRATDRFSERLDQSPRPRRTAIEALTSQGVPVFFQPTIGW